MMKKWLSLGLVASAVMLGAGSLQADIEVKIGTLAPKSSPWGKVFQKWQDAVAEQSNGDMTLTFYWNGSQGDEAAMIEKMKSGNLLDGAAVTSVGLSKVWKPVLALQLPGVFRSWAALDAARNSMLTDIKTNFEAAGFYFAGAGDVGLAHVMTKGYAVHTPQDLNGRHPYMWADDVSAPALWSTVGGVTPVPLKIPEVLPALKTNTIDLINAPALAAQQLQWSSELDNINSGVTGCGIGALILKKDHLNNLSADQLKMLLDTGAVIAESLTQRIRSADKKAFESLKSSMTVTDPTSDDTAKWSDVFKKTREKLKQGVFEPSLVTKLEGMAG